MFCLKNDFKNELIMKIIFLINQLTNSFSSIDMAWTTMLVTSWNSLHQRYYTMKQCSQQGHKRGVWAEILFSISSTERMLRRDLLSHYVFLSFRQITLQIHHCRQFMVHIFFTSMVQILNWLFIVAQSQWDNCQKVLRVSFLVR